MERLWAPWRIDYITSGPTGGGCIFCDAPGKDPAESLLLFSNDAVLVMLNRYPYASAHLMVAPARHAAALQELTPRESAEIFRLLSSSTSILSDEINAEGFNVGVNFGAAAGAGIADHIHFHVVPRWAGDTNFMPVLADTKVMPEHLAETRRKLAPRFSAIRTER